MVVIAFASLKGGTGKTTLTYNLASLWADRGKRVLAVDFDPQGNLTFRFSASRKSPRGVPNPLPIFPKVPSTLSCLREPLASGR